MVLGVLAGSYVAWQLLVTPDWVSDSVANLLVHVSYRFAVQPAVAEGMTKPAGSGCLSNMNGIPLAASQQHTDDVILVSD